MVGDLLVQVTAGGVRLLSAPTGALLDQWLPPPGLQINVASASPSQVQPVLQHLPCSSPPPEGLDPTISCPESPAASLLIMFSLILG